MLLFGIASVNLIWMHFAIRRQERAAAPEIDDFRFLPELQGSWHQAGSEPGLMADESLPQENRATGDHLGVTGTTDPSVGHSGAVLVVDDRSLRGVVAEQCGDARLLGSALRLRLRRRQ